MSRTRSHQVCWILQGEDHRSQWRGEDGQCLSFYTVDFFMFPDPWLRFWWRNSLNKDRTSWEFVGLPGLNTLWSMWKESKQRTGHEKEMTSSAVPGGLWCWKRRWNWMQWDLGQELNSFLLWPRRPICSLIDAHVTGDQWMATVSQRDWPHIDKGKDCICLAIWQVESRVPHPQSPRPECQTPFHPESRGRALSARCSNKLRSLAHLG